MSQGVCHPRRLPVFLFPCELYLRSMVIGPCTFLQAVLGGVTWPWVWKNLFTGFSSLLHSLVDRPQETWWSQTSTVTFGFTSLSDWKPGVYPEISLGVKWAGVRGALVEALLMLCAVRGSWVPSLLGAPIALAPPLALTPSPLPDSPIALTPPLP